jgi:hypothetical protein
MKDQIIKKQEELIATLYEIKGILTKVIYKHYPQVSATDDQKSRLADLDTTANLAESELTALKSESEKPTEKLPLYDVLELNILVTKFNNKEYDLREFVSNVWNTAYSLARNYRIQPQSEPRGETADMKPLFRKYMETIAPVRFKQIFESTDWDDGILIEECFHYFARMAMEEYKNTESELCDSCGKYKRLQGNGIAHQLCECGNTDLRREMMSYADFVYSKGDLNIIIERLKNEGIDEYLQSRTKNK